MSCLHGAAGEIVNLPLLTLHNIKELGTDSYSYEEDEWHKEIELASNACNLGHSSWHASSRRRQLSKQHLGEELLKKSKGIEVVEVGALGRIELRKLSAVNKIRSMISYFKQYTSTLSTNSIFVDKVNKAREAIPAVKKRECDMLFRSGGESNKTLDLSFWRTWHMTGEYYDSSSPLNHPCV